MNLDALEEAHQLLDECARYRPNDPALLKLSVELIVKLYESGLTDVAMNLISALVQSMASTAVVAEGFLELLARENGIQETLPHLTSFLKLSHDPIELTRGIVRLLRKHGLSDIALNTAEACIQERDDEELRSFVTSERKKTRKNTRQKNLVVFVEPMPRARTMKMAAALRKKGWETVLLHESPLHFDASRVYSDTKQFRTQNQALTFASTFNPTVYHVVSGNADMNSYDFIKERLGPTIFDPYDTVEGLIKQDYTRSVGQIQRFCMENADGICCRDLRIRHLKRSLGYALPRASIFFPDYLRELRGPAPSLSLAGGEIHVAHAGSIVTNKHTHETDWGILDVGKAFALGGVHFHIYPSQSVLQDPKEFERIFEDYLEFEQTNPYFHLYKPVPMDQLAEELRKYQFAFVGSWNQIFGRTNPHYTTAAHELCLSARMMDYIEAGICPIVPKVMRVMNRFGNRFGAGLTATPELFAAPRKALTDFLRKKDLQVAVRKTQESYLIDKHVHRLIQFYEQF